MDFNNVNNGVKPYYIQFQDGTKFDLNKLSGLSGKGENWSIFSKGEFDANCDGKIDNNDYFDLNGDGMIFGEEEVGLFKKFLKKLAGKDKTISQDEINKFGVGDELLDELKNLKRSVPAQYIKTTSDGVQIFCAIDYDGEDNYYYFKDDKLVKHKDRFGGIDTFEYLENGCISKKICKNKEGIVESVTTFEYYDDGRLKSKTTKNQAGNVGEIINYTYEQQGDKFVVIEVRELPYGTMVNKTPRSVRTVTEYNSQNEATIYYYDANNEFVLLQKKNPGSTVQSYFPDGTKLDTPLSVLFKL